MSKEASNELPQDWVGRLYSNTARLFSALYGAIEEIVHGFETKTIPMHQCCAPGLIANFFLLLGWDRFFWKCFFIHSLYPTSKFFYSIYALGLMTSGFWFWGIYQLGLKKKMLTRLSEALTAAKLKNALGKLPGFIYDKALDDSTRKLKLTKANIPLSGFHAAKDALQSALQVYIDEMRDNLESGTIEIVYSHSPMPSEVRLEDIGSNGGPTFLVGVTRSKKITASLSSTPHLLVAGQTGGGKSTFLRQLITTLYLKNRATMDFTLIDLKGGMEFQLFEQLKNVNVVSAVGSAVLFLNMLAEKIDERIKLFKEHKCKDIEQYIQMPDGNSLRPFLKRHLVVVDEAAELFLAGDHAESKDIQSARRSLSRIARQGRSLGVHLVIATQRPDSRALDPQVKANLPGVLCFQMVNDVSSISVLGNGRATDLPSVPGRAIWKEALSMVEVQTPFLPISEADKLLEQHKESTKAKVSAVFSADSSRMNNKPRHVFQDEN